MSSLTKQSTRLSANMRWVLQGLCDGKPHDHGCSGRSGHGARIQTLIALRSRGLIDEHNRPTTDGLALCPPATTR